MGCTPCMFCQGASGAGCPVCNPRVTNQPNTPGTKLHPIGSCSLVESLGSVVDDVRQIATDLGVRPYRVFSIVCFWSGGEVGRGTPSVIHETEFLPTPKLMETSGVRGSPRSGGVAERGDATLRQVSPRYTEDQVRALCGTGAATDAQGQPIGVPPGAKNIEIWIEVRVDSRDGDTQRRRFIVVGQPFRDAEKFEWRVTLMRQDQDRSRAGIPYPYLSR